MEGIIESFNRIFWKKEERNPNVEEIADFYYLLIVPYHNFYLILQMISIM